VSIPHSRMWLFNKVFSGKSTYPLRQILTNNAGPPRFTAAAGTELAGTSYLNGVIIPVTERALQQLPSLTHKTSLDQSFLHCPIFPTAASIESGPCLSPCVVVRPFRPTKNHWLGGPLLTPTT
jgi:hypothetical protein